VVIGLNKLGSRAMNDDIINAMFASNKLKLESKERDKKQSIIEELSKKDFLYESGKKFATNFKGTSAKLFELAISKNDPSTLTELNFEPLRDTSFSFEPWIPVQMGILLICAHQGHNLSAKRFNNIVKKYDDSFAYIPEDEVLQMQMAEYLFSPEITDLNSEIFEKYQPGTHRISEELVSKLSRFLVQNNPESFFALALATIKGLGADKDIIKAYKLLTIAAGMGHIEAKKQMQVLETMFPVLVAAQPTLEANAVGLSMKIHEISKNDDIQMETKIQENGVPSSVMTRTPLYSTPAINPQRICLAMMIDAPHCTVIAVASGTAEDWITSLPSPCHLLFETLVPKENNTVLRCLRLLEANGYPANSGELCAAPPHIAMESLMVATYQLGFERGPLVV
jgi:hypothetical protein